MDNFSKALTTEELNALREGIKRRYKAYHLLDRDRFPEFIYNTNRANYEPLRESFALEIYKKKGFDQANSSIHLPSTNTLSQLFTDANYVPSNKILKTLKLYAVNPPEFSGITATGHNSPSRRLRVIKQNTIRNFSLFVIFIILLTLGYPFYSRETPSKIKFKASGLIITSPKPDEAVPRKTIVEGTVVNADTVYLLAGRELAGYVVQQPIPVNKDGTWKGQVYLGSFTDLDTGTRFQIRAFVHPAKPVKEQDYFRPWPKAELMTRPIEVVKRHPKNDQK